ncbi:fimbrillin family protein [Prevotella sp. 10(H)]|uniref:fimbrillin family protein n=1 Tax=Prevotella sp. 10(H) TaxID=1158294 RepID=UPI0004A6EAD8|nr:fimbrillin family protein [Prevotella sp. 10(H)]
MIGIKNIPIYILLVSAVLFWSCSNDDDDDRQPETEYITLFPKVEHSPARISGNNFDTGDKIGVFVVPYTDEAGTIPGDIGTSNYAVNVEHTYNGTSWLTNNGIKIPWPNPERNVDIFSYYPYMDGFGSPDPHAAEFSVQADQRTQAGYTNSDFLWSEVTSVAPTRDPIDLLFSHKLSKVRINVRSIINISDEDFQSAIVSILNLKDKSIIDLSTGRVTVSEQDTRPKIFTYRHSSAALGYSMSAEAIVIPQTVASGSPFIRVDFPTTGTRYNYSPTNIIELESGKERTFNITITSTGISVAVGEITDWEPSDVIHGEIGKPLPKVVDLADIDWNQSLVYRVYDNGIPLAEISREYVYRTGTVDYPAIVVYKIGSDGLPVRTNALIARVYNRNRNMSTNEYDLNTANVHGGSVSFNTSNAISSYTAGGRALINKVEITETGISIANDNAISILALSPYVLHDVDNNEYSIVKVSNQYWMSENLKTEHYRDGSDLTYYYYNNDITNKEIYGGLYTWAVATDARGICPDGWHVPVNNDFVTIYEYLRPDAGGKMKANTLWSNLNNNNNVSGFTGLPGGRRTNTGVFNEIRQYGQWWTSTATSTTDAYRLYLDYGNVAMHNVTLAKTYTQSIRCVRDN